MSERPLKTLRKSGDFQAEHEGSIPFTRSRKFDGLGRIFRFHSDNQAEHRSNFRQCYQSRERFVAVMPAISSPHQPLPLFRFRSCAITADRRLLTSRPKLWKC
jgi:hypothetical protein